MEKCWLKYVFLLSRFWWPNVTVNLVNLPSQLTPPVSTTFAFKPTPQGFLSLLDKSWWDLLTHTKHIFIKKVTNDNVNILPWLITPFWQQSLTLSPFYYTEATFGRSDGRALNWPQCWQDQTQHGESREQPQSSHWSNDAYHKATGVPEGK